MIPWRCQGRLRVEILQTDYEAIIFYGEGLAADSTSGQLYRSARHAIYGLLVLLLLLLLLLLYTLLNAYLGHFLRLTSHHFRPDRLVDLLADKVHQKENVERNVSPNKVQKAPAKIVSHLCILHKHCEVKHEPEGNQDDNFVDDLNEVMNWGNHRPHREIKGEESGRKDVCKDYLEHDWTTADDYNEGIEKASG